MSVPLVFLLNCEAEREIAGEVRDVFRAVEVRPALLCAVGALLAPGDAVLARQGAWLKREDDFVEVSDGALRGFGARAFCPTPRAREALARRGFTLDAPPAEVIARVLSRRFAYEACGPSHALGCIAGDPDHALEHMDGHPEITGWLLRTLLGFAGKGRRVATHPDDATLAFLRRACREGGVLVEPHERVIADYALHGYVDLAGAVTIGSPVRCDVRGGTFRAARLAGDELGGAWRAALLEQAERAGSALASTGYWGPFGVDAFACEAPAGARFVPRCELNARYTMAWGLGMAGLRVDRSAQGEFVRAGLDGSDREEESPGPSGTTRHP